MANVMFIMSGVLSTCSSALAHLAKQAAAPSADLSWLWSALIGVVGAIVGGLLGGWCALRAVRQQWLRDREDSKRDRSGQAAFAIAESSADLEQAVISWASRIGSKST